LIADAVAEALSSRDRAGYSEFMAEPLLVPGELTAGATLVGRRVGPYVIEAEIGRGGMGSVWRARRADDRYEGTVAIKFLHASWVGRHGEQRFRAEGRLLGRLDHANIARLIDAGILDATQPYLVLEYIEGEPIDAYCARHDLSAESRVRLFLNVLAAVAHAHSHLIVHRDIKPSNVLVTHDGIVKLLDFGIAKLLDDETGSTGMTRSGMSALTPQYAAPEQLLGKPVTTETDVYSLGLVLFILLTGNHPIHGESNSSAALMLTQDAPRASALVAVPTIRARELQGDLDNILGKALKRSPEERYSSVGAFADDLKRFLAHEPVQARPDTVIYLATKFVRRHRGSVFASVLVALGLIATSSFAVYQLYEARAERDVAVGEAKRANAEADLAQFLGGDSLSKAPQDAVHERLDRARQFIASRFRKDPPLAARLLIDVSAQYADIGDERTAAAVILEAEAIGRRFGDQELLGLLACMRTQDLAIAHDLAAARVQLASGIAKMQLLRHVAPGLRSECASAAAFVTQEDGDFAQAVTVLSGAVEYLDQSDLHGSSGYTSLANDLARAELMTGDYHEAWRVERNVLALMSENGRANTPAYFALASVGCMALRAGGQPRHSLEFVDSIRVDAQRAAPQIQLPYYFEACRAMSQIALGGTGSGDAENTLLRAARDAEQSGMMFVLVGFQAPAVAAAIDRGDVVSADARWTSLAGVEQKMLADKERGVDIVTLLLVHARLDMVHGFLDGASQLLDQAAELIAARKQPINRDAGNVALMQAQVLLTRHSNEEAYQHAQAAVEFARAEAVDPRSSAWIGEALVWRARAEAALGNARAAATAREALPHLLENLDVTHPIIAAARNLAAGHS
jgi:tetratricopeptide (TPR) repeat protein